MSQLRKEASHLSLACSVRTQAALGRQELAKKRPDFVPAPKGTYVWGQKKGENTPRSPKRKATPLQKVLVASNQKKFPRLASGRKNNQRRKGSKTTAMSSPVEDKFEMDMTLLLSAAVTAVATASGRTSEEAEKVVWVAMTAMIQTVTALKGRKLEASKQLRATLPSLRPPQTRLNCAAQALTTGPICTAKVYINLNMCK